MTIDASTSARAATARMVVPSYPRAANIALAAPRMARRAGSDRGPPVPGTGTTWFAAAVAALRMSITFQLSLCQRVLANDC